jgi:hypothetical protein
MSVTTSPLGAATKNPWLTACIALVVGLLAGLFSPQSEREREFVEPLARRAKAKLAFGLRGLVDRTLVAVLGRR